MDDEMLTLVDNQRVNQKTMARTWRCQYHSLSVVCVDVNIRASPFYEL